MQVTIKKFDIDMPVKANGMELGVRTPDGAQQCKGRTKIAEGGGRKVRRQLYN